MAVCGGPTRRGRRVKRRIGLAGKPTPWQTARLGEDLDLRPPIRPRRLTTRGPGGSHGRTDVAPSHRLAVPVGHHPGGWSRSHRRPMACSRLPPPSSSISWALKRWERHQQWLARRVRLMTSAKFSSRSGVKGCVSHVMESPHHGPATPVLIVDRDRLLRVRTNAATSVGRSRIECQRLRAARVGSGH